MKPRYCFLLLPVILFFSCTKEIDIDIPEHKSRLVINSLFNTSRMTLNVSQSTTFIGAPPKGVFGSQIIVYIDGELLESATATDSVFKCFYAPRENRLYTIKVSYPGFETVYATDSVPSKTEITYIETTKEEWVSEIGTKHRQVKISFTDNDSDKNYFELKLYVRYLNPYRPPPEYDYVTEKASVGGITDPVLEEASQFYSDLGSFIFDDNQFNGGDCNLELFAGILNNDSDEYELIVELNSISKQYHDFKKQLGLYKKSLESDIFSGMPDPINLFSNIENGYGIFAAYVTDKKVLNITN